MISRPDIAHQYTVTGPRGAWIKTWRYGTAGSPYLEDRALDQACDQAAHRWSLGLGRHHIEIRRLVPRGERLPPWEFTRIEFHGPDLPERLR